MICSDLRTDINSSIISSRDGKLGKHRTKGAGLAPRSALLVRSRDRFVGWGYSARLFAAASSLITSLLVSVERQILVVLETSASKSIAGLEIQIQRIMEQKQSKMGHAVWRKRWKQQ